MIELTMYLVSGKKKKKKEEFTFVRYVIVLSCVALSS